MLKQHTIILVFLLSTLSVLGQEKMRITLKNGEQKEGLYKIKWPQYAITPFKIVGYKNKEKYRLKDFTSLVIFKGATTHYFEVISTKKDQNSKKVDLKFGQVVFDR